MKKSQNNSTENCHSYSCGKMLYIAWACFRNGLVMHVFMHSIDPSKLEACIENPHFVLSKNRTNCQIVHLKTKMPYLQSY